MYVTIDPGAATGWAIWTRLGLVACGLGDPRTSPRHVVRPGPDSIDDVWIERPVIYPRSKARPNDILTLAVDVGRWSGIYEVLGVETHYVAPAEWKGQLPKAVHHERVWRRLRADEQAIVTAACKGVAQSKRHNVLDAVGLGLWVRNRVGLLEVVGAKR